MQTTGRQKGREFNLDIHECGLMMQKMQARHVLPSQLYDASQSRRWLEKWTRIPILRELCWRAFLEIQRLRIENEKLKTGAAK